VIKKERFIKDLIILSCMERLYLIRHGNATYDPNCLTRHGERQVRNLVERLKEDLPENKKYLLVSSDSERVYQTAERILPLIKQKSIVDLTILKDPSFSEADSVYCFGEKMFEFGKDKVPIIEAYGNSCDVLVIASHNLLIAATGIAIAEKYGMIIPQNIGRIKTYTEKDVQRDIKESGFPREKVIATYDKLFCDELPEIPEASAVSLNFIDKEIILIQHTS
jgi:hypothetical protein